MNKTELRELIYDEILGYFNDEIGHQFLEGLWHQEEDIKKIKNKCHDVLSDIESVIRQHDHDMGKLLQSINSRMEQIEKMIQAHAVGVQNVYNAVKDKQYVLLKKVEDEL